MNISSLLPTIGEAVTNLAWAGVSAAVDFVQSYPIHSALFAAGLSTEVALSWTRNVSILASKRIDLRRIVELCPWVEKKSDDQHLIEAIEKGDSALAIGYIVDRNADHLLTEMQGYTIIHLAAKKGLYKVVELLIARGANVGRNGEYKASALLHWAVEHRHLRVVRALLRAGADVDHRDHSFRTPLSIAAEKGYTHIARYLLDSGANLEALSRNGRSPLFMAVGTGAMDG